MNVCKCKLPIPVFLQSKAKFYGLLFAGIVGSNLAEGMDILFFYVVFDELITRSEESYRVGVSLTVYDFKTSKRGVLGLVCVAAPRKSQETSQYSYI